MNEQLKQLEQRIEKLEQENKMLKSGVSFPKDVQDAIKSRLNTITPSSGQLGTFTQSGLERSINLTGNSQTITVLEYPTRYIPVLFRGTACKIPIFTD